MVELRRIILALSFGTNQKRLPIDPRISPSCSCSCSTSTLVVSITSPPIREEPVTARDFAKRAQYNSPYSWALDYRADMTQLTGACDTDHYGEMQPDYR